jgi:tRNA(Ile)-lysidine synthase
MSFDSQQLLHTLRSLTAEQDVVRWLVAFSGGMDSAVLLHALANVASQTPVVAVHINHGLHDDADGWAEHCRQAVETLDLDFIYRAVVVNVDGVSLEAAARDARYAELATLLRPGDFLLSAHHQSDQAETLLLNLMRGSGPAGLAGIGMSQRLGAGRLLRPLLDVSLDAICNYATSHQLSWLDDPSNMDTRFDRNFLRHEILPRLTERWPAVARRLARSAELLGEANDGLVDLADVDLASVGRCDRLSITALQRLSQPRQRSLLRHAIRLSELPSAPATRLEKILTELIPANADRQPLVSWEGAEVRRFRDEIFILPEVDPSTSLVTGIVTKASAPLDLGPGLGVLSAVLTTSSGIAPDLVEQGLELRFRCGGETLRIEPSGGTKKLKKLLQESDVLPWMRSKLPLFYVGERLVAVADLWVDARCRAEPGFRIDWRDPPTLK